MVADEYKAPPVNKTSKLYKALRRNYARVLEGRMLVLDPSAGSETSKPGYCIFVSGVETERGTIDMPVGSKLQRRLYYLNRCLREQFKEKFDVLVVEQVPTHRFNKYGGGSVARQMPLHYATAAILCAFDVELDLMVAPQTWRAHASEAHLAAKDAGESTDARDAAAMAHTVVRLARYAAEQAEKPKKRKGRKKKCAT